MTLHWRKIDGGIEASLPTDETGACMTARITVWWGEVPKPEAGLMLRVECDLGPVRTVELFDITTPDEGIAKLADSWRGVLARSRCAMAAWEACP